MVELAVFAFGRGPAFPSVGFVEQVGVLLAIKLGLREAVQFEVIEVLEEQQPRGLLGVVELGGASGLLTEDIIDIPECLFEHVSPKRAN